MVYSSLHGIVSPMFLAGKFISEGKLLEVSNPYDAGIVGKTFLADDAMLEKAIQKAEAVKIRLSQTPLFERYRILSFIADKLEEKQEYFARLICCESAKPIQLSFSEVARAVQTFRVAAEESRRLPAEYIRLDWTIQAGAKEGLIRYFPAGIVAGISPFNFPLNLAVHKLAPAIAAGCPIILKPSSSTPLSTLALAEIIAESGLPEGAVSILPMDRRTGNHLVTDSRISVLSFTGSPEIGWTMKHQCGKKKVVLELGGNAAVMVSHINNMERVINQCVMGAFSYSGQVCIHTQRIFVMSHLIDEFTEAFIRKTNTLNNGNPLDDQTDISVMIDEANARRVELWVNEAVANGARVLCGGHRNGSFFEPTLITSTQRNDKVYAEEIFGPVAVIEPIGSLEEGIRRVNEGRFGLQAGLFTDSITEMNMAFEQIETGGLIINDVPNYRTDHMPYGGIKDSGLGREGVKYAIHDMLEAKILVKPL